MESYKEEFIDFRDCRFEINPRDVKVNCNCENGYSTTMDTIDWTPQTIADQILVTYQCPKCKAKRLIKFHL